MNTTATPATGSLKAAAPIAPQAPRLPDPANYGWTDNVIRNTYHLEVQFDAPNTQTSYDTLPQWLSFGQSLPLEIHARDAAEARELAKQAPAAFLRAIGLRIAADQIDPRDGGVKTELLICAANDDITLKEARVLTRADVEEFLGDVPLTFRSHYKQEWCFEGRQDHLRIEWSEIDTDHRYAVDVTKPITINERGLATCRVIDERRNLIVFESAQKEIF
jgi:hypothetical protein